MSKGYNIETKAIHLGFDNYKYNPVMPPIYVSSTYKQHEPGVYEGRYDYGRTANPTRDLLERTIAGLENGNYAVSFSSGCAALTTLLHTLKSGDHVLIGHDVYAGTLRLFKSVFADFGVEYDLVDLRDQTEFRAAMRPNSKMVFFETPTNPLLDIVDIKSVVELSKQRGLLVCVDNTFATPVLQNPLDLGADVVLHSSTKYLGGHSDLIGGALVLNDKELYERLLFLQNAIGAVPSPFDCFLLLRSLKTLVVRVERHCDNAEKIAAFLSEHKKVRQVRYPGLADHPGYSVARKQMRRFGGMLSFELDCDSDGVKRFLSSLRLFAIAESLGGVESLIEVPSIMTHAYLPKEQRDKLGISDSLIRMSVGIENVEDLIQDLESAFEEIS